MSVTEVIREGLTYKQFRWNVFFSTQRVTDTWDEINWQGQRQTSREIKKKWDNTLKKTKQNNARHRGKDSLTTTDHIHSQS